MTTCHCRDCDMHLCEDCQEVEVSAPGEVCAECSVEHIGPEDGNDETPEYEVSA